MSRWTLRFALALACWLPLQTALAWLPVQQPDQVDVSASDSSRTSSSSAQELGAVAIPDCHGMEHSQPTSAIVAETTSSQHPCSSLMQWMPDGCKHCTACVLAPADLLRMAYTADWVRRQPTSAPEFEATHYANFIPGIPVPPPLSFHGLQA